MSDSRTRLSAALADRYRLERELGAGGMATVYLAHDVRHDRKVAMKILKPELSAVIGAERFLVEIKTTANLQHPHILPLFDSGQVDGTVFYVMPFVEGESLRDRLVRERQLPVADALRIATEVAGALDYAHRRNVIHRDIKPENILLHDGRALVADFGIALAASRTEGGNRLTETGMSLGTPHYMSPEQALGERTLDARTDVYALGCVLHEMLVGEPPFSGPTAQAVIARVLSSEPESVTALRRTVPDHVGEAVLTALAKLPADRFSTAADFAAAIGGSDAAAVRPATVRRIRPRGTGTRALGARLLWPAAFASTAAIAGWGWFRPIPEPLPSRLSIPVPALGASSTLMERLLDISADGRVLLYRDAENGRPRLVSRRLEDETPTPLPKVPEGFTGPVISPDGREFVATNELESQLFRFPIEGGEGRPLPRELSRPFSMAWSSDGTLWLTLQNVISRGIARLSPSGEVTYPFPPERNLHAIMQVLPGDRYALAVYVPMGTSAGPAYVFDLQAGSVERLFSFDVVEVRYAAGFLVYVRNDGTMEAVRFDLRTRRPSGAAATVATDVSLTGGGTAHFAVAANGTVVYVPEASRTLLLMDRAGTAREATSASRSFHSPRFSPDGRQLLTDYVTPEGRDVWRLDLATGAEDRITFDRDGHDGVWAPDGRNVTYTSATRGGGALTLYRAMPGRASEVDSLISDPAIRYTGAWLPDGSAIVTAANGLNGESRDDIGIIRNAGRGPVEPVVATRYAESFPTVSPDGRWLAYTSDQTGTFEVYVRPLEREGESVRVSLAGGGEPVWGPDGRELFYRAPASTGVTLVAASLRLSPMPAVIERKELFDVTAMSTSTPHSNYDISPDGRTFAMVRQNPATRIVVIQQLPALVAQLERGGRR